MIEKKTLVLIHGWGMHSGCWRFVIPLLEKDYTVVCLDLPGHGKRVGEAFPSNAYKLTDQLHEETRGMGAATWVGWSLGGLLALAMSLKYASRVKNLVLVGAVPCFLSTLSGQSQTKGLTLSVLDEFKQLLNTSPKKAMQRLIALIVSGEEKPSSVRKKLMFGMKQYVSATPTTLNNGLSILRNTDLSNEVVEVQQPTLLLVGENDYFIEERRMQKTIDALPNGKAARILGAGHAPFISQPDVFVDKLNRFIGATHG